MSMVSAKGEGSWLTRLPLEVVLKIVSIEDTAEILRRTCIFFRDSVHRSVKSTYDERRNAVVAKALRGIPRIFQEAVSNDLGRFCEVDYGFGMMVTEVLDTFLDGSVESIESKITKHPELIKRLNDFLKQAENFHGPKLIKDVKKFIGLMSLLSNTLSLNSSHKETLIKFYKVALERIFNLFDIKVLETMSQFVKFFETISEQCLRYEQDIFSLRSWLNLPKPKDLLDLRDTLIVLLMKDYLESREDSLLGCLNFETRGSFYFKIGQNLNFSVKDQSCIVTRDYVYLGERCDEDKSGKGVRFNRDGSILYGGFDRELKFDGKGILVFPNKKDNIVFEGKMVEDEFKGSLSFYSIGDEYLNLIFDKGVCTEEQRIFSIRFGGLNYFKADSYDGASYRESEIYYFDGFVYTGQVELGLLHGQGKLMSSDGVYEGGFQNDKFHGQGKFKNSEVEYVGKFLDGNFHGSGQWTKSGGLVCEGQFEAGNVSWRGMWARSDDLFYDGQFENGKFHGKGKLTCSDGIYDGQFENGKYHGKGKLTSSDGCIYDGQFENGDYHGDGKLTSSDGEYEGQFKNGNFHGKGKLRYSNEEIYEGQFENGKYHGKGKLRYSNDVKYEGQFENGKYHGKGKLTSPSGDVYEGQFENGKYHGKGNLRTSDVGVYDGEFKNGKFHGQGKWSHSDGGVYEGQLENGKFHGNGILECSNGNIKNGQFIENKLYNGYLTIEEKTFPVKDGVKKDVPLRRSSRKNQKKD